LAASPAPAKVKVGKAQPQVLVGPTGSTLTITGANFTGTPQVDFKDLNTNSVAGSVAGVLTGSTSIKVTTPTLTTGAGPYRLAVSTGGPVADDLTGGGAFFDPNPAMLSVSPPSGSPGTTPRLREATSDRRTPPLERLASEACTSMWIAAP